MKRQRLVVPSAERVAGICTVFGFVFLAMMWALVLLSPAHAGSTTQRDAPTVRFYTPDGKSAGTASTYGNTTKFYAPDGKLTGSATRDRTR